MGLKTWSTPVRPGQSRLVPCCLCGGLSFRPALACEGFSYLRCRSCGLVQMNPQPLPEETLSRYGADYLAYELAREKDFLDLQLRSLRDVRFWDYEARLKGEGSPRRVLDAGCATGALLALLRDRGWTALGVEISAPQAEYATRERRLDVRSLPLEENRFPGASFEAVLASHLIEHLNDPRGFAEEARRILVPGGLFLVTTPNLSGFQARISGGRWRSAIFDHLYLFSVKTLSRLLKSSGFKVEKTVTWGGLAAGSAPAPVKRIADLGAKRLGFGDVMILRARAAGG